MPKVQISAARFSSLLANRNLTPADVAERANTRVRPDELASSDLDVEFENLLVLAKLFKRPSSYLLVDKAEQFPDAGDDNRTLGLPPATWRVDTAPRTRSTGIMKVPARR
jgi:hypothetical protein